MARPAEPKARAQLLEKVFSCCTAQGFRDMSLRHLAGLVGTSHRMLLYHFKSRENLMREIIEYSRRQQLALMSENLSGVASWDDFEKAVLHIWTSFAAAERQGFVTTFFEIYVDCLRDLTQPQAAAFLEASETAWLTPLKRALMNLGLPDGQSATTALLVLGSLRGLLLQKMAGGDPQRTEKAFKLMLRSLQ